MSYHLDLIDNTDITFVVETSDSISEETFQNIKMFIEDIVLELNIGINNSRVAVILFNHRARLHFNLNQYTDMNHLIASIRSLPYSGGGIDIPDALNLLGVTAQNGALGIKADSRQIAIFLTGGGDDDIQVIQAVNELAVTNIFQVYSVGVGRARLDQLNYIASNNSEYVYYHSNSTNRFLPEIAELILERLKGTSLYTYLSANVYICSYELGYVYVYACVYVCSYVSKNACMYYYAKYTLTDSYSTWYHSLLNKKFKPTIILSMATKNYIKMLKIAL